MNVVYSDFVETLPRIAINTIDKILKKTSPPTRIGCKIGLGISVEAIALVMIKEGAYALWKQGLSISALDSLATSAWFSLLGAKIICHGGHDLINMEFRFPGVVYSLKNGWNEV